MIAILHIADTQSDKKQMERRGKILRIEELKVKAAITELIETCLNNTFLEFCGEREKYDNVRSSLKMIGVSRQMGKQKDKIQQTHKRWAKTISVLTICIGACHWDPASSSSISSSSPLSDSFCIWLVPTSDVTSRNMKSFVAMSIAH
jgi:hypothetical protein